jgi:hypothetical protein
MNLFRSEEHLKKWSEFEEKTDEGILSLYDIMAIFSTPRHTRKLDKRYVSAAPEYGSLFIKRIEEVTGGSSLWDLNPQ